MMFVYILPILDKIPRRYILNHFNKLKQYETSVQIITSTKIISILLFLIFSGFIILSFQIVQPTYRG